MKKFLMIIFLILVICPVSKSKICEELSKNECKTDSSKYSDYCCYFTPIIPSVGDEFCKTVPYSSFYKGYKKEFINGTLYNVSCDEPNSTIKTFPLEQCGNSYENKDKHFGLKNCKKYSTLVNSCCYFSEEKDDFDSNIALKDDEKYEKGCYWLGSKYEGEINWAGIKLVCNQKHLNYYLYSFFIFIGILLL